jgi:hypothetical protein
MAGIKVISPARPDRKAVKIGLGNTYITSYYVPVYMYNTMYDMCVCFCYKELRSRKMKRNEKDVTIPVRK